MVQRVDPLASTPPAFEIEAARQILRTGFGVEAPLTPLAGERDQNFRVDTPDGPRFLLKISNPADGRPILEMQTAALRHIEQVDPGLPVMRALPTAAGNPGSRSPGPTAGPTRCGCSRSCPGGSRRPRRSPPRRSGPSGRSRPGWAGRCGASSTPRPTTRSCGTSRTRPSSARCSATSPDGARRAQVARVLDRFEARVAPALPGLRAQVIHADMSLDNVLFDEDSAGQRDRGLRGHDARAAGLRPRGRRRRRAARPR